MISKEQLQQLIKQGATIYKLNHLENKIETVLLDKKDYIGIGFSNEDVYVRGNPESKFYGAWYKLEDLFETEEDARWEIKMTTTRTETLKMPKWEEMTTENNEYNYYGSSDTHYFSFDNYRLIVSLEEDCEYIGIDVCGNTELHHWEDVTKENYIEACKLCLKLFKGEKENEKNTF